MTTQVRRIVTGHDHSGKAIISHDDTLTPVNPLLSDHSPPTGLIPGYVTIHATTSIPDNPHLPFTSLHGRKLPLTSPNSVTCRIVDFPPLPDTNTPDRVNFMHRTLSTDYGVVLQGKIVLVMDSGDERVCEVGDVVVQRGTNHAWKNTFQETCRMMFVLVPAEPVQVEETGEVLKSTDTRHLTDEGVTERVGE